MKGVVVSLICALTVSAHARDFGVQGEVHEIVEVSPVEIIQAKLSSLKESGEYENFQSQIQEKMKNSVTQPKPLEGWTPTLKSRTYIFDPTFVVPRDITDHKGRVLARKGMRINPLDRIPLERTLLFIDGRDEVQVAWALSQMSETTKIILVAGSPLALMKDHSHPVYYDQGRMLLEKFKIVQIPARLLIRNKQITIEELLVEDIKWEVS